MAAPPRARTLLVLVIAIAACVQYSAAANTRSLTSARRALASSKCKALGFDGYYFTKGTKIRTTSATRFDDCAAKPKQPAAALSTSTHLLRSG